MSDGGIVPDVREAVLRAVAVARADRWGYTESLAPADLADYIKDMLARDQDMPADLDIVLATLAQLGRLLPDGGEQREELSERDYIDGRRRRRTVITSPWQEEIS